jgi:hypothetical protein
MEQNQMSKFCIDLEGVMLPDAIAAVVEAWYDAQSAGVAAQAQEVCYTIPRLEKVLNRSRATIYRYLNISESVVNPPFDPYKLNHEFRSDLTDPVLVSSLEVNRWKKTEKPSAQKANNPKCRQKVLDHVSTLINAKLLTVGDKMPSTRDLADKIQFHRNSVTKVYEDLEREGALSARPGSGVYITDISKLMPVNAI